MPRVMGAFMEKKKAAEIRMPAKGTQLMDRESGYIANALRQNFFRAGHVNAGVITLLSIVAEPLVDAAPSGGSLVGVIYS
jgi:hypothetical protein